MSTVYSCTHTATVTVTRTHTHTLNLALFYSSPEVEVTESPEDFVKATALSLGADPSGRHHYGLPLPCRCHWVAIYKRVLLGLGHASRNLT